MATNNLEIGREYKLKIEGHKTRTMIYLGLKQRPYKNTPNAMFIEDHAYIDGKPAVLSVNIPANRLSVDGLVLNTPIKALSSGLFSDHADARTKMKEEKWEELLKVA